MSKEMREKIKEEEYERYYLLNTEPNEEYYLTGAEMEGEYYISDTEMYDSDDSFFINERCPFYNLITEDYPVIDDGDDNNPISRHTEKRPIAEYCNFVNDYSFNCCGCAKNE